MARYAASLVLWIAAGLGDHNHVLHIASGVGQDGADGCQSERSPGPSEIATALSFDS
jgi:hypothetical protein